MIKHNSDKFAEFYLGKQRALNGCAGKFIIEVASLDTNIRNNRVITLILHKRQSTC